MNAEQTSEYIFMCFKEILRWSKSLIKNLSQMLFIVDIEFINLTFFGTVLIGRRNYTIVT